jgi:hypothetical protein
MPLYFNVATGFSLPPYFLQNKEIVKRIDENTRKEEAMGVLHFDEVRIKWEEETGGWTLPLDPVISVTGKNLLVRRNVLKTDNTQENRRGSVKEIWSQEDYEISIAGVLIGSGEFPEDDLRKLRGYMEARKILQVESRLFSLLNITQIAVEEYGLPFTKGIENQMYTIKGYSDDLFDLFVREEG